MPSSANLIAGKWHHIALVNLEDKLSCYVDGKLLPEDPNNNQSLDLDALSQAAQSIAGDIQLASLLEKLLRIIAEAARSGSNRRGARSFDRGGAEIGGLPARAVPRSVQHTGLELLLRGRRSRCRQRWLR